MFLHDYVLIFVCISSFFKIYFLIFFIFLLAQSCGGYPRRAPRGAPRGPEVIYESVARGSRGPEGIYGVGGGICQHGWGTISLSSLTPSNYSISNISGIFKPQKYRGVCKPNQPCSFAFNPNL